MQFDSNATLKFGTFFSAHPVYVYLLLYVAVWIVVQYASDATFETHISEPGIHLETR